MFLKKHFSKLEPKVKKLLAGVLSVAMIAGAVLAGISIKAGARSKTQDVLNELLGAAKPYGLVAEELEILIITRQVLLLILYTLQTSI